MSPRPNSLPFSHRPRTWSALLVGVVLALASATASAGAASAARTPAPAPSMWRSIDAGMNFTCGVTTAGAVKCWGTNGHGQLGTGNRIDAATPQAVVGLASGAVSVSAGAWHACAVMETGDAHCWGFGQYGQLGNGTFRSSTTPVLVADLAGQVAGLSAGANHTCVVTTSGTAACWGANPFGQLGDGTRANRNAPVRVFNLDSGVRAIAAGDSHTCAATEATAYCWGRGEAGALGTGNNADSPVVDQPVLGIGAGPRAITAGGDHSCLVRAAGSAWCWGANGAGQLGVLPWTIHYSPVRVPVFAATGTISAGSAHTCAIRVPGGAAYCWGYNEHGAVGNGTNVTTPTPTLVSHLGLNAAAISAGLEHTCAIRWIGAIPGQGYALCWGANDHGQLGDGTLTDRWTPVRVVG